MIPKASTNQNIKKIKFFLIMRERFLFVNWNSTKLRKCSYDNANRNYTFATVTGHDDKRFIVVLDTNE